MASSLSLQPDWIGSKHDNDMGMLHRFKVQIGDYKLGGWQKVLGLKVEFKLQPVQQAGFNTYTAKLLQQPDWDPIVLERVVLHDEWTLTYKYLSHALASPQQKGGSRQVRSSGALMLTIQVDSAWGDAVRTLHFMNARPVKWEGPQLSAASTTNVATEKLTFVHEGLFPDGDLAGGPTL